MQLVAHNKTSTSASQKGAALQKDATSKVAQVFKASFSYILALALAGACFFVPTFGITITCCTTSAWATNSSGGQSTPAGADDDSSSQLSDLEKQVQQSANNYNSAVSRQEELASQIKELDSKIAQIEEQLPQKQAESDESVVALYKYSADSASIVQMLLDSKSVVDMLTLADQYSWVINRYLAIVEETQNMKNDLDQSRVLLKSDKAQADEAANSAASALEEAKAARQKAAEEAAAKQAAQTQAASSSAEERKQQAEEKLANASTDEEREAAREEIKQAKKDVSQAEESASSSSATNVDWSSDKSAFVNEWAERINDYLSGSPTAGTGKYYASAAWDYGVDPRWAPAISCIESSKGAACFRSYNAWGFGARNFSSWQDGITTVVRCLGGSLYGGHLTQEAAQKYCPPTWQNWYNDVSSEMSKI